MNEKPTSKWQPVLLIANRQLTCVCGNLAIFVTVSIVEYTACIMLEQVDCWCQDCFGRIQEEEEGECEQ